MASKDVKPDLAADKKLASETNTTAQQEGEPGTLPQYFDSEPSSQPPLYNKPNKPRNSVPTSKASIAAIMGPPPAAPERKRSWADRWRDFRSGENYGRNLDARRGVEDRSAGLGVGSSHPRPSGFGGARLSVFGSVLTEAPPKSPSPNQKK